MELIKLFNILHFINCCGILIKLNSFFIKDYDILKFKSIYFYKLKTLSFKYFNNITVLF